MTLLARKAATKITTSSGLWANSVLILFTLKDTVESIVNEMPLHNKSQTHLFGNSSVYTLADFSLHLFIFLVVIIHTYHVGDGLMDSMCRNGLFSHPYHCRTPHSTAAACQRSDSGPVSHCDGQLEISFYFDTVIVSHFPT